MKFSNSNELDSKSKRKILSLLRKRFTIHTAALELITYIQNNFGIANTNEVTGLTMSFYKSISRKHHMLGLEYCNGGLMCTIFTHAVPKNIVTIPKNSTFTPKLSEQIHDHFSQRDREYFDFSELKNIYLLSVHDYIHYTTTGRNGILTNFP